MKPIISHMSALEFWRSARVSPRVYRAVSRTKSLLVQPTTIESLAKIEAEQSGPWWLSRPLDVIVSKGSARRRSKDIVSHVWSGDFPKGTVVDAGNGFCVCSPELCFVQIAETMDLPKLIEVGFELCGTYDVSDGTVRRCKPLTTVGELTTCIHAVNNIRGRKTALRALRYIVDNAASPMETILTMLLCLPYSLGGYGIEKPLLNHRIDVTKKQRAITTKSYYVCDLYWPSSKLTLEYDSDEFHSGEENRSGDSSRRTALLSLDILTISVTKSQVYDSGLLNAVAREVSKRLGKQLRYKDPEFTRVCLALRRTLLG